MTHTWRSVSVGANGVHEWEFQEAGGEENEVGRPDEGSHASGARILVVDDEDKIRDLVGTLLEDRGFVIDRACSVPEAVEALQADTFDLVLTDLRMPERDGLDLVRHLRDTHPDVASVIVTGYASTETAIEALRLGVSDYLKKPFRIEQLQETVDRALGSRERRQVEADWKERVQITTAGESREAVAQRLKRQIEDTDQRLRSVEQKLALRSDVIRLVDRIHTGGATVYDLSDYLGDSLRRICDDFRVRRGTIVIAEPAGEPRSLVVRAAYGAHADVRDASSGTSSC